LNYALSKNIWVAKMRKRNLVLTGLMVSLVIFGAYLVIQREMRPLVVLSESMKPSLQMGDLIIVERISPEEVEIEDVLVFRDPGGRENVLITHRVINRTEEGFHTKGDACEKPDPFMVKPEDVVGKPVLRIPYIGYLVGFGYLRGLSRLFVFAGLVIAPSGLLIFAEVKNILADSIKLRKRRKKAKEGKRKRRRKKAKI
jgi:signal peptidase